MLGTICVSVHWYAYISTHSTCVSAAVANSIALHVCRYMLASTYTCMYA